MIFSNASSCSVFTSAAVASSTGLHVARRAIEIFVERIGDDQHLLRVGVAFDQTDELLGLRLLHAEGVNRQHVAGLDPLAQRFPKREPADRLRNFLRVIARLRTEDDTAATPNDGRLVTSTRATGAFLPPRLGAGKIDVGLRLRVGRTATARRAHRDDGVVHRLRATTVLDHVDLRLLGGLCC